jgi:hypothetical protein
MTFPKAKEIVLQRLHVCLQIGFTQGQLSQDPMQATDVRLYQLAKGQFTLIPFMAREAYVALTLLDTV